MNSFKDKIVKLLTVKKLLLPKKIYAYSPLNIRIHKTARIKIEEKLRVNEPWKPTIHNVHGRFDVGKNATIFVSNFCLRGGVTLIVKDNAELHMGTGYMNSRCEIYCNEKIVIGNDVIIAPGVVLRDSDTQHKW